MNEKANRTQEKKGTPASQQSPPVKSATPENAAGKINPSAPTESTEQGSHAWKSESHGKPQLQTAGSQQAGSASNSSTDNKKSFRCADAGYRHCNWHVEGSENEILPQIEQHAKDVHHVQMKPESREQVRHLMKNAA